MKRLVLLLLIGLAIETAVIGIVYTAFQRDFAFSLSFIAVLLLAVIELVKLFKEEEV